METRRLWPEVIIGGFVWLLALWSFADWTLGCPPDAVWCQMQTIAKGEASLVTVASAVVFAASYFLGALANRLLSALFGFCERKLFGKKDRKLTEMMATAKDWELRTHEDRYSAKLMFRSVGIALVFLFLSNGRWIFSAEHGAAITWMFIILAALCLTGFWLQKRFHEEFSKELSERKPEPRL